MNHQSNTQELLLTLERLKLQVESIHDKIKTSDSQQQKQDLELELDRILIEMKDLEDAIQRDYWLA